MTHGSFHLDWTVVGTAILTSLICGLMIASAFGAL